VSWTAPDEAGGVVLHWGENDGPGIAVTPERVGFGSRLIATSLKGDLSGSADLDYALRGLKARLTFRPAPGRRDVLLRDSAPTEA
jgi:hypothetical protein